MKIALNSIFSGNPSVRSALVAVAVILSGNSALASPTVIARYDGFDPNAPITIQRTLKDPYLTGPGTDVRNTSPGRFSLTRQGGDFSGTLAGTSPQFFAFCLEPLEFITPGSTTTFDLVDLRFGANNIGGIGVTKADLIRELFYQQMPDLSAVISNEKASALGIAVWEIVRENPANPLDIDAGDAQFDSSSGSGLTVLQLARNYLSTVTGTGPRLDNLYALRNVGVQDLLVQVSSVPEPATIASFGLGALGLVLVRRKR
ncbi:MAG: PEP-CTERM sorting domain-containing protein [Isosphaeraceae bacterium]|nr:PEP-CTERM sorting domain-containing protein [Isosphaeraceae bacterium]